MGPTLSSRALDPITLAPYPLDLNPQFPFSTTPAHGSPPHANASVTDGELSGGAILKDADAGVHAQLAPRLGAALPPLRHAAARVSAGVRPDAGLPHHL